MMMVLKIGSQVVQEIKVPIYQGASSKGEMVQERNRSLATQRGQQVRCRGEAGERWHEVVEKLSPFAFQL